MIQIGTIIRVVTRFVLVVFLYDVYLVFPWILDQHWEYHNRNWSSLYNPWKVLFFKNASSNKRQVGRKLIVKYYGESWREIQLFGSVELSSSLKYDTKNYPREGQPRS